MKTLSRRRMLTALAAVAAGVVALGAGALGRRRRPSGVVRTSPEAEMTVQRREPSLSVRPAPRSVKRRG